MPCVSSSAASDVSLARLGSRIIRAEQSSATPVTTAEYVAKEWPAHALAEQCFVAIALVNSATADQEKQSSAALASAPLRLKQSSRLGGPVLSTSNSVGPDKPTGSATRYRQRGVMFADSLSGVATPASRFRPGRCSRSAAVRSDGQA